ncbi:MurR/RpiR family transcriptional regulator [Caproiciproducens sp. MSJ-32]|uniref:MurR/RpiR family transcriptional regulator n=1 Tax=Caproiciproducens sp. MSJ-32 TaxID=2841527 RepID=UPI001C11DEA7|nr:MurR/RpiR family transcriptional regulator [Caproiciproducens sp. MSJ-32]MBU5455853.1 MurR/RpiR family transcriptional regulator [Caproiciproducens sp. MSJ-32]
MSKEMSCLLQMRKNYSKLSAKEIEIANFILEDPHRVIYYTIDDFSKALNVSEATVSRFVRKLGFKKFQVFKVALANEITTSSNYKSTPINKPEKNFQGFSNTIFEHIKNSSHDNNEKTLAKLKSNLIIYEKVAFLGIGNANELAYNAYNSFPNANSKLLYNQDFIFQKNIAFDLSKNDLAILFCTNEEDEDYILEITDILKKNHVTTIGFSYNSNSIFSKSVTYSLASNIENSSELIEDMPNKIYILSLIKYMYNTCFSE